MPEGIMRKWLELRDQLWARKLRLGGEFPEIADLQLRLASEVLRDLEELFGPLDRRAQASSTPA
jgi:hypothetical protein